MRMHLQSKEIGMTQPGYISEANNSFRNLINDIEYIRDNEFKVNRTYVLLNELERSLEFRDVNIFLMNYRNVMQSLDTMN